MSTRKDFLATAGATSALFPLIARAQVAAAPRSDDEIPPLAFERAKFDALTSKAVDHRHLFAAQKIGDGYALEAMTNTYNAYTVGLHESKPSLLMAAVFYHGASIALAFNDHVWNALLIPALAKFPHSIRADIGKVKAGGGNPHLHQQKETTDVDTSVERLAALGSLFFVCNNATVGVAGLIAEALGRNQVEVYTELAKGLVPSAMLVPAGVWAVHALQEAKFTYLQAT